MVDVQPPRLTLEEIQKLTLAQLYHLENPDWGKLASQFHVFITDPDLVEEFPDFFRFFEFAGGMVMNFLRQRKAISRDVPEEYFDFFKHSGFHDPVMSRMTDTVLQHYGLFTPLTTRYLLLKHLVNRLGIDIALDLFDEFTNVENEVAERVSQEDLDLLDLLADNTTEMILPAYNSNVKKSYLTNVLELFRYELEENEYKERIDFLNTPTGELLRSFKFIYWFEKERPISRTTQACLRIAAAFAETISTPEYQEFKRNIKQYCERIFNNRT